MLENGTCGIWNNRRTLSEQSLLLTFWKITLTCILAKCIYQKESWFCFPNCQWEGICRGRLAMCKSGHLGGSPGGVGIASCPDLSFRKGLSGGSKSGIFFHTVGIVISQKGHGQLEGECSTSLCGHRSDSASCHFVGIEKPWCPTLCFFPTPTLNPPLPRREG